MKYLGYVNFKNEKSADISISFQYLMLSVRFLSQEPRMVLSVLSDTLSSLFKNGSDFYYFVIHLRMLWKELLIASTENMHTSMNDRHGGLIEEII